MAVAARFALALTLPSVAWTRQPAPKPAATVEMTGRLTFNPSVVQIKAGETVLWKNNSVLTHTVTAEPYRAVNPEHFELPEGAQPFDSGYVAQGQEFSHTFEIPGTYKYFCVPHETYGMVGIVIVTGASEGVHDRNQGKHQDDQKQKPDNAGDHQVDRSFHRSRGGRSRLHFPTPPAPRHVIPPSPLKFRRACRSA